MDDHGTQDNTLKTTATSLSIVEIIKDRDGATLQEITDELEIARSSAYSHLDTLRQGGILAKEGNRYQLGLKLFHLGVQARNRKEAYQLAEEVVAELAETTGEEADFYVEDRGRLIALHDTIANSDKRTIQIGDYFYMHNTAIGKAILAEKPDEEVRAIVERWGLPRTTQHTITTTEELIEELETIRERGYAINDEEHRRGLRAVGAALTYPDGTVIGGFSIGGPTYRLALETLRNEYSALLSSKIEDLRESLSW